MLEPRMPGTLSESGLGSPAGKGALGEVAVTRSSVKIHKPMDGQKPREMERGQDYEEALRSQS